MKLKVCGMKYYENIEQIAALKPDYLGFIFYKKSARFMENTIPELPSSIQKVGVFVNEKAEQIAEYVKQYKLQVIQLHGNETPEFILTLKKLLPEEIKIIKVFAIQNHFDFSILQEYEALCDYFLFDTKGKLPGGNGFTFDWEVLNAYPSTTPYFLSGGIGLEELTQLNEFMNTKASKHCHAIDVNSKFELEPGLKKEQEIHLLKNELNRFQ